jgi:hypothetical protein
MMGESFMFRRAEELFLLEDLPEFRTPNSSWTNDEDHQISLADPESSGSTSMHPQNLNDVPQMKDSQQHFLSQDDLKSAYPEQDPKDLLEEPFSSDYSLMAEFDADRCGNAMPIQQRQCSSPSIMPMTSPTESGCSLDAT